MKKIVSLLLILLMGVFILPTVVLADPDDNNGDNGDDEPFMQIVVDDEIYEVLKGEIPENVTYDEDTNTLTLNNFTGKYIIAGNMDLDIELKGNNSVTGGTDLGLELGNGSFTFTGDGSLDVSSYNQEYGIAVLGDLTIESGTISVTGFDAGIAVYDGDFTINGGVINIAGAETGIVAGSLDGTSPGKILLNGGKINIEECEIGIFVGDLFKLNGSSVLIDTANFGILAEDFEGSLEFEKGKIIIQNTVEGGGALAIGLEDEYAEEMIKFNGDNLYIDNSDYDFRVVELDHRLFIVIGPEDTYYNAEDDNNIAKEVSILPKEKKKYEVTEGNGQKVYQKADSIKINADLDKFVALYINDELVDEENYELKSGSTIISLKDEYVKKLSAGNYKFKAVFTDGEAEGEFTVTTENPNTGDNIIISIILFMVSIGSLVLIRKIKA